MLTDASIKGKVDPLLGLKENAIICLFAGTGMSRYRNIRVILKEGQQVAASTAEEEMLEGMAAKHEAAVDNKQTVNISRKATVKAQEKMKKTGRASLP